MTSSVERLLRYITPGRLLIEECVQKEKRVSVVSDEKD